MYTFVYIYSEIYSTDLQNVPAFFMILEKMEIGLYNPQYWNGGCGSRALKLWIHHLFSTLPLVRVVIPLGQAITE